MANTFGSAVYGLAVYGVGAPPLPPVISNIFAAVLSASAAQITWTTDIPASSRVDYGTTSAYGSSTTTDSSLVTSHLMALSALQPNTTYHYRVVSTSAGGTTASPDRSFVTSALSVSLLFNFKVESIGPLQVTVSWQTTQFADGYVRWGQTQNYDLRTANQSTLSMAHGVTITGLLPNTIYHLQAISFDALGASLSSSDLQITTPLPQGRIYTWIEPNGTSHVLDQISDPAFRVLQGAKGYGVPPTNWIEDHVPQRDGSVVRDVLYDTREIEVPLMVTMPDYSSLLAKVRTMRQWMNVKNGDGSLQIADPDGTIRQYTVRLKAGLEGEESTDTGGSTWRRMVLVFRTTSPTPYANWPSALSFTFAQAVASATWFPWIPIILGGAGIFSNPTINNPGDVDAEPIWTLVGPMTNPVLTNTTTGSKIALTVAILTGQSVTIDTRFRIKSVVRNDGTKLFSTLSNDSSLWMLVPGVNVLSVVTSGTSGTSQVQLTFLPRTL